MSSNQNLDAVAGDEQSAAALDNLMDTPQDYDPDADNDVAPPPPPDRAEGYDVLVRLQDSTDNEGGQKPAIYSKIDKNGKPMVVLALDVSIDEPGERYDGYHIRDWQNSQIREETGSSGILNFCRLIGQPMPRGLSPRQQMQYLEGIFTPQVQLAGIPLHARTRWEAMYRTDDGGYSKPFIKGMNRFPVKYDKDGNPVGHEHVVDNPAGGDPVTAQAKIARYMAREEQAAEAAG